MPFAQLNMPTFPPIIEIPQRKISNTHEANPLKRSSSSRVPQNRILFLKKCDKLMKYPYFKDADVFKALNNWAIELGPMHDKKSDDDCATPRSVVKESQTITFEVLNSEFNKYDMKGAQNAADIIHSRFEAH